MIAHKWFMSTGAGVSKGAGLPSFDKALIEAGVGNYNLVRLSSILPAGCRRVYDIDLQEGSLLPTAYSTITSDVEMETVVSGIAVGIPKDPEKVGVIMEYSTASFSARSKIVSYMLHKMIEEAFEARGWELDHIEEKVVEAVVGKGEKCTTFACIAEW